jgi:hypothetical protein
MDAIRKGREGKMSKPTYSEMLKDPRWQRKRLEILERDEWTCQNCTSTTATLHVHHKVYDRGAAPWEYDDDLLVTYCEECHEKVGDTIRQLTIYAYWLSKDSASRMEDVGELLWALFASGCESEHIAAHDIIKLVGNEAAELVAGKILERLGKKTATPNYPTLSSTEGDHAVNQH